MKLPRFKPIYCNGRTRQWAITVPPYLSPTGRTHRRYFLTLREAKAFGDHMRRQYDDHDYDSTYLHRDRLAEAAKAYKLIEDLTAILPDSDSMPRTYTLLDIVQEWCNRQRLASKSVTLEALIDEHIAARKGAASLKYMQDIQS
jgi:hypothetical protein